MIKYTCTLAALEVIIIENCGIVKKGYARVSSVNQHEDRQLIELRAQGIPEKNIYIDKQSGKDFDRCAYKKMYKSLKKNEES